MGMDVDVVVVGMGPTGLLLAGDLARDGIAVAVLERRSGESNLTRAFAVHARTLELLDARDIAEELIATGHRVDELRLFGEVGVDLSGLPSRFPFLLATPQYETERLLHRRAIACGAKIVTGVEVTALHQDGDGIDVHTRTTTGPAAPYRARYVVGADGQHSTVRRAAGLPFPGRSVLRSIMLADVRLRETPPDVFTANAVRDGLAFVAPFGDGWYRIFAWDRYRQRSQDEPVALEEVRDIARKALGTDYGMHEPRWLSRFHSDERQAPRYRVDRAFLVGDAAHVHSPAGGQGMNTGLQDAANLSWKLAAVLRGQAPESLLDTYEAERHPVGRLALRTSGTLARLALLKSPLLRALRGKALGAAVRFPPTARRIAGMISGIAIRYPAPPGTSASTGQRAPDTELRLPGGRTTRLYELLRSGQFVAISPVIPTSMATTNVLTAEDPTSRRITLVRPDGYIAAVAAPDQDLSTLLWEVFPDPAVSSSPAAQQDD